MKVNNKVFSDSIQVLVCKVSIPKVLSIEKKNCWPMFAVCPNDSHVIIKNVGRSTYPNTYKPRCCHCIHVGDSELIAPAEIVFIGPRNKPFNNRAWQHSRLPNPEAIRGHNEICSLSYLHKPQKRIDIITNCLHYCVTTIGESRPANWPAPFPPNNRAPPKTGLDDCTGGLVVD